jgi:tetratricopeptide (TPR) repeat protein
VHSYGIGLVLFAALVVIVVYTVKPDNNVLSNWTFSRNGNESIIEEQVEKRLKMLDKKLKDNPDDIFSLLDYGILKYQKGPSHYVDAIASLEEARNKGSTDYRIFYYLGVMYQAVGLYEYAQKEYRRFLNHREDDFEVRMLLAKLLFKEAKFEHAIKEYEYLNLKYPKNIIVLENLALSRWKNSESPENIIAVLRKLGEEGSFRADYLEGMMSYENKEFYEAINYLEKIVKNWTYNKYIDLAQVYAMLGDSYVKVRANSMAIESYNELLKIDPDNDEAKSQLSKLTKKSGTRTQTKKKK